MNIKKKILIPGIIILALLIICGIAVFFFQPKKLDFWAHVDAHTKYTELQQEYNPDPEGWKINRIYVHHKEDPDSEFVATTLENEAQIAELVNILSEIKVIDKPRENHKMGTYSYALQIVHPNYMDVMIEFNEDIDEMWIIFSYINAPAYKVKNTSAFRQYLEGLFE